jgi:hypothetical protein
LDDNDLHVVANELQLTDFEEDDRGDRKSGDDGDVDAAAAALDAVLDELMPSECTCGDEKSHVKPMSVQEQQAECEKAEMTRDVAPQVREWMKHTEAYRQAANAFGATLLAAQAPTAAQATTGEPTTPTTFPPSSLDGETPLPELTMEQAKAVSDWAQVNHPKLCCTARHANFYYMLS